MLAKLVNKSAIRKTRTAFILDIHYSYVDIVYKGGVLIKNTAGAPAAEYIAKGKFSESYSRRAPHDLKKYM